MIERLEQSHSDLAAAVIDQDPYDRLCRKPGFPAYRGPARCENLSLSHAGEGGNRVTDVEDPTGQMWKVRRKTWWFPSNVFGWSDVLDVVLFVVLLPLWLGWPFWFLAKLLGVPWVIVIERGDETVGTERVRGLRAANRRVTVIGAALRSTGSYPPVDPDAGSGIELR